MYRRFWYFVGSMEEYLLISAKTQTTDRISINRVKVLLSFERDSTLLQLMVRSKTILISQYFKPCKQNSQHAKNDPELSELCQWLVWTMRILLFSEWWKTTLLVTSMTLVTDCCNVAGFAVWSAMVTVDARTVDIKQWGAGAAAEVLWVPSLIQSSDTLLQHQTHHQCTLQHVYFDNHSSLTLRMKPLQAAHLGTNLFL